jgi:hypothetical protein
MSDNLIGVAATLADLHLHLFDVDHQSAEDSPVIVGFHGPKPVYARLRF